MHLMCYQPHSIYTIKSKHAYLLHVLKYCNFPTVDPTREKVISQNTEAAVDIIGNIKLQHVKCLCRNLAWVLKSVRRGGFIGYIEPNKPCPYPLLYIQNRPTGAVITWRKCFSVVCCFKAAYQR